MRREENKVTSEGSPVQLAATERAAAAARLRERFEAEVDLEIQRFKKEDIEWHKAP